MPLVEVAHGRDEPDPLPFLPPLPGEGLHPGDALDDLHLIPRPAARRPFFGASSAATSGFR